MPYTHNSFKISSTELEWSKELHQNVIAKPKTQT